MKTTVNVMKLVRRNDEYAWIVKDNATQPLLKSNAKAFGVWWLRIDRKQVEAGIELMKGDINTAVFSSKGDFLYVEAI
jgi:hypothetical protein